jgi:hypothetical protein
MTDSPALYPAPGPRLTVAWREAFTEFPNCEPLLAVIRKALDVFKDAMLPVSGIINRLQSPQPSTTTLDATAAHLGAQGQCLAMLFRLCNEQRPHRFVNDAKVNAAWKRVGWQTTMIAANLAASVQAQSLPELWADQMERIDQFNVWESQAGLHAENVQEEFRQLKAAMEEFATAQCVYRY